MAKLSISVFCRLWLAACGLIFATSASAQISAPAEVSGLAFHVDAADINGTGLQPANNDPITQWTDLSGNGYHLTSTAAERPFFQTAGFTGSRPGIRFEVGDRLSGPDILPSTAGTMTIFFVNNNVTSTANFALSVNGNNTSNGSTNGRYSFHAPWTNGDVYFDAGGCCGAARLQGTLPNAITDTSIYTAQNNLPGNGQVLRIDGTTIDSDATGHAADSTGGIIIGATSGRAFNGRFAEIIVYNRALTASEIGAVEQYLYCKWKPSLSTQICADVQASKSAAIESSPSGDYSLPGSTVRYTIAASNAGPLDADADTIVITDEIPDETILSVADIGGASSGPVIFTDGSPSSGMSYTFTSLSSLTDDVDFSDDEGLTFTYVPTPDGLGLDEDVTHIRISPKLTFKAGSAADPSDFSVSFDVYLK